MCVSEDTSAGGRSNSWNSMQTLLCFCVTKFTCLKKTKAKIEKKGIVEEQEEENLKLSAAFFGKSRV